VSISTAYFVPNNPFKSLYNTPQRVHFKHTLHSKQEGLMWRPRLCVRPPAIDLVAAAKGFVGFLSNSVKGFSLQNLSSKDEFRENMISDNYT
jgi:hypothetical protein